MLIVNNASSLLVSSSYNKQNSLLQTAMARLASGDRLVGPADDPADLGISERFRSQVVKSEEAGRVIQNAINMFTTAGSWLQETQDMLNRMSQLAFSASDASKSTEDRANLDLEYQQLKQEISRISEAGKYNKLQINGSTSVAVYDFVDQTIVYSQADGTETKDIGIKLGTGNSSTNGVEYKFASTENDRVTPFIFTANGDEIIYLQQEEAQTDQVAIAKLDISTDSVTLNSSSAVMSTTVGAGTDLNQQVHFIMDDDDRIWLSNIQTTAMNTMTNAGGNIKNYYTPTLLNVEDMEFDTGGTSVTNQWAGGTTAMVYSKFTVHDDFIYYFHGDNSNTHAPQVDFVKQSLFDASDRQILISNVTSATSAFGAALDFNADNIAVSQDGLYIAWEDHSTSQGTLQVINTDSLKRSSLRAGDSDDDTIVGLGFDKNNNIYWTDSEGSSNVNAIVKAEIAFGDQPTISNRTVLRKGVAGRFGAAAGNAVEGFGLSVAGGSPNTKYKFQVGPDVGMSVDFVTSDVEIVSLGISSTNVKSVEDAKEAISRIAGAVSKVSNARAVIGAQVNRLQHIFSANESYNNNIALAESRIRDVDFAKEASQIAKAQILAQTATKMLQQSNALSSSALSLLQ